ncbi:hypothetical protein PYW07_013569 [Mythimna separata]|uniref:RNA-directed DNA polymerase n=1 Tax=Mythimna separata TaxID=271217 RepID=A0AAD7YFD8_MYTSE|nr:hypothetical protein PYW07_013569 [Mythimna separata]
MADTGVQEKSHRLYITDKNSKLSFLVDTGANISVLPRSKGQIPQPLPFQLYAANNTTIATYGEKTLTLDLNLRRPYLWKFIVADVTKPILGADFLKHHQLIVDLKNRRLIDGVTSLKVNAPLRVSNVPTVRSIDMSQSYHEILAQYPGITRLTSMKLNSNINVQHFIETTGPPIHSRARPIPPHRFEIVKKEFENMIAQGLCRPSKSPWSSPLHIVPKKNGDIRVYGDYRRLNSITIPDRYPVPRVKDFTHHLSGKTIFSTIDLNRAYQQLSVREEDIQKTAIITPMGLFEFPRMCPGLKNAGQTFQRYIHEVLRGLDFVFPFIDDLLLASENEDQHREHLHVVLKRLEDNGITINPAKCNLGKPEVQFLGYTVTQEGIKPPQHKIQAITDYPQPKTIEELRRFLGMINFYREHIPNAAVLQAPLNSYLHNVKKRDKTQITWTSEATQAFQQCKASIIQAALLAHPSHHATLALFCDASDNSAGAVLQQYLNETWQPLGYFSKKFSEAQKKYSTYDRELLAMYMAVKHFRKTFEGRHLIIFTDHKPLTFVMTKMQSNTETPRRTRQLLLISEFTTDIRHVSGKQNIVADTLSRIETISCPSSINFEDIASAQRKDSNIEQLLQENINLKKIIIPNTNIELYCETSTPYIRPYIPEEHRQEVFNSVHNISHPGTRTTRKLITQKYFWPSMNADISRCTRTCIQCQKSKIQRHTFSNISSFPPTERFQHVHVDIVGPLPTTSQGHRYLVTMIDRLTKWPEAIPTDEISAVRIADIVYQHWISRFGCPTTLTSDQGPQFESQLFQNLMKVMGIKKNRTTPYHPQSNGMIERWHRSLKTSLRAKLSDTSTWVSELPTVLLGLRAALRTDTGVSAAELTYGYNLRLPGDFFASTSTSTPTMDYTYVEKLRDVIRVNKPQAIAEHHSNNKRVFVHEDLLKCSHVFIRTDAVKKPLQAQYEGPYRVISRTEKVYTIQLPNRQANISIDRLKPAYVIAEHTDTVPPTKITITNTVPPTKITVTNTVPPSKNTDTKQTTASTTSSKQQARVPTVNVTSQPADNKRTRSGRIVKLSVRFA